MKRAATVTHRVVLLTVAGETGATGVHAVCRVGLVLASGAGNAIIQPRVPAANSVRDFLWEISLAMKDPALSTVAGETGATGALAVCRVGLVQASGAGNAIIQPRVPAANSVQDFLLETSLAMKDPALSTVAGETGPTGALAVHRVGLVQVSGAGNAIIRPQVPVANSVRDFL